jgi:cytidylate kinase
VGVKNIVITISRQLGSGGSYIGRQLEKRLGYKYVDREILKQATEYLGEDETHLAEREESLSGFWENIIRAFAHGVPEAGYVPPPVRPVNDEDLFKIEAAIMKEIADKCSAIIVGRAGFHVLRGHPGLVNVFIHASKAFRVKRIMEVYDITDADKAASLIEESDSRRGKFISAMTGARWLDALNYHLCIDASAAGFSAAEQMIVELVDSVKANIGSK